uniref:SFRICE_004217 n=1 Tax=Spodoptera frugiperda TaxID=7108 RepID=A0A2H1V7W6_SPOFR
MSSPSGPEILEEVRQFYGELYPSKAPRLHSDSGDPKARLVRYFTEELTEISLDEMEVALGQLKNDRTLGGNEITTEFLKVGGKHWLSAFHLLEYQLEQLRRMFDSVLFSGRTLKAWSRSLVVMFLKKGDKTLLKNYLPISLLSHVYKLFSRVITNSLARRLDEFQPPEQAGFRGDYGTVDHIHTMRQIIQKIEEYLPLCLAFVDYEKAFDSIDTWSILESLQRSQVLRNLYDAATMVVQVQNQQTEPIHLHRGVR